MIVAQNAQLFIFQREIRSWSTEISRYKNLVCIEFRAKWKKWERISSVTVFILWRYSTILVETVLWFFQGYLQILSVS